MELLNKNGLELMNARRRFLRHYANDIDNIVKEYIYSLYKEGRIPEKLFRILLDEKVDDAEVYAYLVSRREFTKSSVELNSEFDITRAKVNEKLIDIGFTRNVRTENSPTTNRIYIIKQYDVPKDFLLSYFGLTPIEIIPLMRRKGFMDKFCVLRLLQVFKEIYTELEIPDHVDHQFSKVYYNNALQGFSLDYKYMVNLNYLRDPARLADVVIKIKNADLIVEKGFKQKMSSLSLSALMESMNSPELQADLEKIEIPTRTGRRFNDIRVPYIETEEDKKSTEDFFESKETRRPHIDLGTAESPNTDSKAEEEPKKVPEEQPQRETQPKDNTVSDTKPKPQAEQKTEPKADAKEPAKPEEIKQAEPKHSEKAEVPAAEGQGEQNMAKTPVKDNAPAEEKVVSGAQEERQESTPRKDGENKNVPQKNPVPETGSAPANPDNGDRRNENRHNKHKHGQKPFVYKPQNGQNQPHGQEQSKEQNCQNSKDQDRNTAANTAPANVPPTPKKDPDPSARRVDGNTAQEPREQKTPEKSPANTPPSNKMEEAKKPTGTPVAGIVLPTSKKQGGDSGEGKPVNTAVIF